MIDLSINKQGLEHNIEKAKESNVIIPTIAQMEHPEKDTALVRKICTAMAQPEHRHLQRDKKS